MEDPHAQYPPLCRGAGVSIVDEGFWVTSERRLGCAPTDTSASVISARPETRASAERNSLKFLSLLAGVCARVDSVAREETSEQPPRPADLKARKLSKRQCRCGTRGIIPRCSLLLAASLRETSESALRDVRGSLSHRGSLNCRYRRYSR